MHNIQLKTPKYFLGGLMKGALESAGGPWGLTGKASDAVSSFLPLKSEYSGDKGGVALSMDAAYDTISNIAGNFGPVGGIVSGAMKAGKLVNGAVNALGGGTDGMTTADAILGSSFLGLTPFGLINGFGGKKADTINKDTETFGFAGSSYTGSESNVDSAVSKSGKKYGLFSSGARKRANSLISEAGRLQGVISDIATDSKLNNELLANQSSMAALSSAFEASGGFDATTARAARQGMKFPSAVNRAIRLAKIAKEGTKLEIEEKPKFIFDFSCLNEPDIPLFKDGGLLNVIPEGALHAHKHHMEDTNPDLKDLITLKGIPVVVEELGGELNQQAEIERDEIIFNLDTTKKLEELNKIYHSSESSKKEKDEAAIEAGKLLTEQILNNTDDRTGLISKID